MSGWLAGILARSLDPFNGDLSNSSYSRKAEKKEVASGFCCFYFFFSDQWIVAGCCLPSLETTFGFSCQYMADAASVLFPFDFEFSCLFTFK